MAYWRCRQLIVGWNSVMAGQLDDLILIQQLFFTVFTESNKRQKALTYGWSPAFCLLLTALHCLIPGPVAALFCFAHGHI